MAVSRAQHDRCACMRLDTDTAAALPMRLEDHLGVLVQRQEPLLANERARLGL